LLGLRPFSSHKLSVPAQERLRLHHQAVAPARWQQADERREERDRPAAAEGAALVV
jgi:hypothetical protein